MSLNSKQAFKVGFLQKCAEFGLTTDETIKLAQDITKMVKEGNIPFAGAVTGAIDKATGLVSDAARTLGPPALYGALLAPPAIGGATGYLAARATDISDDDIDVIKKRELINEYLRLARVLKSKNKTYRLPDQL